MRKIPTFRVMLQNGAKYSQLSNIPEIRKIIIEETLFAIKDGIKRKKKTIPLFEVYNTMYYVNLDKSQWKSFLTNAINYYSNLENYEKCVECKQLIDKI